MNKKILLFGFILVILIAIPLTIYLLGVQTKTKSKAAKSTNLSFSVLNGPVGVGQNFNLNVMLDPGQNIVSFIKLIITYDSTKLQSANPGISPNTNVFPVTLEGPTYNQCIGNSCSESITLSVGTEITKAIQGGGTPVTIASLNFQALAVTDNNGTAVTFGNGTQVLSLAGTDQPSENVLSSATPESIIISSQLSGTPSPTDTPAPTSPITPSPTSDGGGGGGGGGGNGTLTPTPTQNPICTSLTADNTSSASAPLTVNFTANGNDPNTNASITKATFNFGDGSVQDVTSGGGIGTTTVNAQVSHTYQSNGLFTATSTLYDSLGGASNPTSCSQTISIGTSSLSPTQIPTLPINKPLPPTGPGDIILRIGIIGAIITALGVTIASVGI